MTWFRGIFPYENKTTGWKTDNGKKLCALILKLNLLQWHGVLHHFTDDKDVKGYENRISCLDIAEWRKNI